MKRIPLWILTAIIVTSLTSSLLWNFSTRAAGPAGRGSQSRDASNNPEKENFDIRDRESKDAILKFKRRMEKLSSKQKIAISRQAVNVAGTRNLPQFSGEYVMRNSRQSQAMKTAKEKMARRAPEPEVPFHDLTNSIEAAQTRSQQAPDVMSKAVMTKSPEVVEAKGGGSKFLTPSTSLPRESVVRGFINDNVNMFGMSPQQVSGLRKVADYTNPNGKLSWLKMEQRWNGMKVFRGETTAVFNADGALVRMVGELASGPEEQDLKTSPNVNAAAAVVAAAASLDLKLSESDLAVKEPSPDGRTIVFQPAGPFTDEIRLELMYFPLDAGIATLAWSMVLWQQDSAYYTLVDAETGDQLFRKNISDSQTQTATYSVYNDDSPAPLSPSNALPGSGIQGAPIQRALLTIISELPAFDNLGWITDGVNTTTGNNVDAGVDIDGINGIDPSGRAVGAPFRVFNFPYNPSPGIPPPGESPALDNYRMGAVTNLFFWSNRYHDRLYGLGFSEAAGNFQQNNFGRGGLGNDFVLAEAQDFSGTNNANFATPPDGIPGRMQMFIFTGPNPDRDGDLDQDVVLHELTHGVSNRLHANASGLLNNTAGGMGEGWSDFYARALLSTADENVNGIYPSGAYATLQFLNILGTNNSYYGIRRFPYAVKTAVGPNGRPHNPLTFADADPAQLDTTDGAFPESPINFSDNGATETHNLGEIWCMALLEMRARIITRLGFATGNQRALQIVTDGMKLDPASPNMLEGRDSILTADCAGFGGADERDIWAGFAARGMGVSARYNSDTSVTEAFDTPNLNIGAVTLVDNSCAPDGFPDPGETLTLTIPLSNPFCSTPANDVSIFVNGVNGGASASYGDIPAGATASASIPFTVPTPLTCGSQLSVDVVITSSLGTVTRTFNLQIGRPVSTVVSNYSSGPSGVSIGDLSTVDIPVNVTDAGVISDINVRVRLNHTADIDLVMTLIGPDGTSVPLSIARGGPDDNFGTGPNDCSGVPTVFDDAAPIPIRGGAAPFAGSFRPESPLSAFNGKSGSGVWVLRVQDTAPNDSGMVGCVTLEITRQQFTCNTVDMIVDTVRGQYSDSFTLRADVRNMTCPGTVEFQVNGSVVGSSPLVGSTATLPYTISLSQGFYPIRATFTSSMNGIISRADGTLQVLPEDAIVTPLSSNPSVVGVNSPGGTAGPVNLCATINEKNDLSLGDISLAAPTFTLTPVAPGPPPITQTATTSGGGVGGTLMACAALNNVPVNVYSVTVSASGSFYSGSGSSALAVFDTSLRSFRGLGTIVRNGNTATFLINASYRGDGALEGGLIYVDNNPANPVVVQTNALQSLSVIGHTGVMVGTMTLNGVANHTFRVTAVDNSNSGSGDRFGLQVFAPDGSIVSNMTFDPIVLRGGNIQR
jgi:subtilisin-like proprotein convertase family protein